MDTVTPISLSQRLARPANRWWRWAIGLCLLLAAGYGLYSLSRTASQPTTAGRGRGQTPSVMPVGAVPAKTGDIPVYLDGLGSVTPLSNVTVRTRVDGQLMRVLFKEGQLVKQGELLAEIDPRPFQVQLTQAEGQMARDQALLKNAQLDLQRYTTLVQQNLVARQQLDTQASLLRQYEGAVKADQGQVDNARLQLTYSRITAPFGGRAGLRLVDPGNMVHASDANGLVVITQLQPIGAIFTIPQDALPQVMKKLQAGATLAVDAFDRDQTTKLDSGVLLTVDNQIDTSTGTVRLKAQFPNASTNLFPNQFVNVRLLLDLQHGATVVPAAAVQRGSQGTYVYVVNKDQTVALRQVKLGPVDGDNNAIASGLEPGELVVVDGTDKLREGSKVELTGKAPGDATPGRTPPPGDGTPAPGSPAQRRKGKKTMSPSRPFILRPVATSLLMVAILLSGIIAYRLAAAVGAARGGLPDHPGRHLLPGRQPRRDDLLDHRAAGAAVRPDAGTEPDVLDQLGRRLGDHAAVQSQPVSRCGRAGGAGRDQRRRHFSARRPAEPADLQQGQPGRHADPDAGAQLQDPAAAAGRRPRRHAARAEDLATARRGPGQHHRRPAARGAHPGQSAGARRVRLEPRGRAHRHRRPRTSTRPRAASTARNAPTRSTPTISCAPARNTRR